MSNEAIVQCGIRINKPPLTYQSLTQYYQATVTGYNGPTPGAILASINGTDINFADLTAYGGLCEIKNLDTVNSVEYGMHDPATGMFYYWGQLLPGESHPLRTSPNLGKVRADAGGTLPQTATLRFYASVASVRVYIGAFDP